MIEAVIFDFDGVIVDTEPLHYRAFLQVMKPEGVAFTWDEYRLDYMGFDDRDAFRALFSRVGKELAEPELAKWIAAKARVFDGLVRQEGAAPYPGAVELINALSGRVPLALCSGALRSDLVPILNTLGMTDAFDVTVSAEDVETSKPDPACYRLAVEKLGGASGARALSLGNGLAIEDTPAGIAAAQGAGLRVLAVTNTHPAEALAGADRVVDSLADLTPGDLGI